MNVNSFSYSPFIVGLYKALLWCTLLVAFVAPNWVLYYFVCLVLVGLFLKPILIKLGVSGLFQSIAGSYQQQSNSKLKNAYYQRNQSKILKRDKHLSKMRDKLNAE